MPHAPAPAVPGPCRSRLHGLPETTQWFHRDCARHASGWPHLVDGRHDDRPATVRRTEPVPSAAQAIAKALALLADERHDAALAELGEGPEPERLLLRAVLLANIGRRRRGARRLPAVLAADSLHAGAYYVQALCEERDGHDSQSVRHDEMAIYLDDTFADTAPASRADGAPARRSTPRARRHARRARELFVGEDDLRILLFGGGFSR